LTAKLHPRCVEVSESGVGVGKFGKVGHFTSDSATLLSYTNMPAATPSYFYPVSAKVSTQTVQLTCPAENFGSSSSIHEISKTTNTIEHRLRRA